MCLSLYILLPERISKPIKKQLKHKNPAQELLKGEKGRRVNRLLYSKKQAGVKQMVRSNESPMVGVRLTEKNRFYLAQLGYIDNRNGKKKSAALS